MRTIVVPATLLRLLIGMVFWTISISVLAQSLSDDVGYAVYPVCRDLISNRDANINQYFIRIDILSIPDIEEDFNIILSDSSIVQFHVEETELPHIQIIGPFNHSGIGNSFMSLSLQSLNSGVTDELLIPEVLCGYFTNNGLNQPGYICVAEEGSVIAQSAPLITNSAARPDQLNIYVLKDDNDIVVDKNYTGLFQEVAELVQYSIHAYAVAFHEMQAFYDQIIIGVPISINSDVECFAFCGMYDLGVRCQGFDLSLNKQLTGGPSFFLGDMVNYNIVVRNEGIYTAYNVVVKDDLPLGLMFNPGLNPAWSADLSSIPIDSIAPGDSVVLPISLIIDANAQSVEIINRAEITFAGDSPAATISAFDRDSYPDNEADGEDDMDEVGITIIDNFCAANFEVEFKMETICKNAPIKIYPIIVTGGSASEFIWVKSRTVISRDSVLFIENPVDSNFGIYELRVVKGICSSDFTFNARPVTDDRTSCISEINLSLNEDCGVRLSPDILTLNDIPSIDQFYISVVDHKGEEVDLSDLSGVALDKPLMASLINPCTNEAVCWVSLNIEYKLTPTYSYHMDTVEAFCFEISTQKADEVIHAYNSLYGADSIQGADDFHAILESRSCFIGWDIKTRDIVIDAPSDLCYDRIFGRIYTASDGRRSVTLDTAILAIRALNTNQIIFPGGMSNLYCGVSKDPVSLSSVPQLAIDGNTMPVPFAVQGAGPALTCNVMITYSDQSRGSGCAFGFDKVVRTWTAVNWCEKKVVYHPQYLYFIDEIAPAMVFKSDTIVVNLPSYTCSGDVDLSSYISLSDNCDPSPVIGIEGYQNDGFFLKGVSAGIHFVPIRASDKCDNDTTMSLTLIVRELTPPVAVTLESVAFTYTDNSSNWIYADIFDNGSHDSDCGPVVMSIARVDEVRLFDNIATLTRDQIAATCNENYDAMDTDHDSYLTRDNLFRQRIKVCCEDIGQKVEIIFRVTDQFGNYTEVVAMVNIQSKVPEIACDDQDPCTYNDVIIDGCPCRGIPDDRDLDHDGLVDCIDDEYIFCLDNFTLSLNRDEIEQALANGAIPGPCNGIKEQAVIAGKTYTSKGQMIENVEVSKASDTRMTDVEGQYAFPSNPKYERYELWPHKNDGWLNGISALDILMIQQNLLGITSIVDPYALIAADVNGDGRVSAADLAELRKLLLGQIDLVNNSKSWRFIPAHIAKSAVDPARYSEAITIERLDSSISNADWIGIKIGDVSGDAVANSLQSAKSRSSNPVLLYTSNHYIKRGQELAIPIYAHDVMSIAAIQLSIKSDNVLFKGIESGWVNVESADFSITEDQKSFGMVKVLDQKAITDEPMFTLILASNKEGWLREIFDLNGGELKDVAYDLWHNERPLNLTYRDQADEIIVDSYLYQNLPNPFGAFTNISFDLSEDQSVTFKFYDVKGQLLYSVTDDYVKGINTLRIAIDQLKNYRGLVYYQMDTGSRKIIRSMVAGMKSGI